MHFSEDDLRSALKRKDPGTEFTERVMARVAEPKESPKETKSSRRWFAWLRPLRLHPVISSAVASAMSNIGKTKSQNSARRSRDSRKRRDRRSSLLKLLTRNLRMSSSA